MIMLNARYDSKPLGSCLTFWNGILHYLQACMSIHCSAPGQIATEASLALARDIYVAWKSKYFPVLLYYWNVEDHAFLLFEDFMLERALSLRAFLNFCWSSMLLLDFKLTRPLLGTFPFRF